MLEPLDPAHARDARDRALLLIGFAAALRRSELAAGPRPTAGPGADERGPAACGVNGVYPAGEAVAFVRVDRWGNLGRSPRVPSLESWPTAQPRPGSVGTGRGTRCAAGSPPPPMPAARRR